MSSYVYPGLATTPGLTLDVIRSYKWKTGYQEALSGKQSTLAYRSHPLVHFELKYELLRDFTTPPSEIKTVVGLHNVLLGRWDTFLYTDGEFNSVTTQQFAVGDGTTQSFQLTAVYAPTSGAYSGVGAPEIIQNLNGAPTLYLNRFGLNEILSATSRTNYLLFDIALTNAAWSLLNLTEASSGTFPTIGSTVYTANLAQETSSSNVQHTVSQQGNVPATTGLDYTFSAFVFPGRSFICLQMQESTGSTTAYCFFNISTGATGTSAVGSNWTNIRTSISAVPGSGGWYKCSITANKTNSAVGIRCYLISATADNTFSYAGANTTTAFYAWGLQLENASVPSATIITTSAAITQADYTIGATGLVANAVAYTAGLQLNWSGSFYYRCRFDEDSIDWTKFMDHRWSAKKVAFTSVLL